MKIDLKKLFVIAGIFLSFSTNAVHSAALCGTKTLERQGEITANKALCITDYGHYLHVNIPYPNSQVTITTSGGTFSGTDASIVLYSGDDWSGVEELSSSTLGTNDESISFTSRAGQRYFRIGGNISQTSIRVSITGGDAPPPLGSYLVYNTDIPVNLPLPRITSKSEYGAVIASILAANYSDFKAIAVAAIDPINDVADALHYLASTHDLKDPDLNQLLYFLRAYKNNAPAMTDIEASKLNIALQAVAKMNGFLSKNSGAIQEGYAVAVGNFERFAASAYFADQLPHLLALIQFYSLQTNPFAAGNFSDAAMAALSSIGTAAKNGDTATKMAFHQKMIDVLSVMRSFGLLGETAIDLRWTTEAEKKWIIRHTFIAMGNIAGMANDEAKARFDKIILEIQTQVSNEISVATTDEIITSNYLKSAGRQCQTTDPLYGHCFVPPKESDILTITHQCNSQITIRAQSGISQATLQQSCADIALQETAFHAFFNTNNVPIAGDKNDTIEVVAFASPEDYKKYAGTFFSIDTDNGGMYLEGNPEYASNQARLIVMQCPDSWVGYSCQYKNQIYNLKHEFVHYLDARYNQAGAYNFYSYNVSWTEGMAEFLAHGTNHTRTLDALKGKVIPPLYNLLFMSYEYDDLYQWGYFAMRYLSEKHPTELQSITAALKAGDKNAYQAVLKTVAARTSAGFEAFVLKNSAAIASAAAEMPADNTIGSCALEQQYVRPVDASKTTFTMTNTTDTPVSLFWINNNKGKADLSKNYKTLNLGESFTKSNWSESGRMMLMDNNMNCLGVSVMNPISNHFSIDASLVKNVIPEVLPAQDQFGSCELVRPHLIQNQSHQFTITNTTNYPVHLFRIDNLTGKPKYESAATPFTNGYGTLAKDESYTSDLWYGNRRIMVTDARLNCLSVGVLNKAVANFTIDAATVAKAAQPEIIPAANTVGGCELINKHLTGPFEADFSFTNTTSTPVRIHRVDNETGKLSKNFGFKTLAQGESYNSTTSWKWFGHRRAAITDVNDQCLGVAVMTEKNTSNDFQITANLFK